MVLSFLFMEDAVAMASLAVSIPVNGNIQTIINASSGHNRRYRVG